METEDESNKRKRNFLQAMLSLTQSQQKDRSGDGLLLPEESDASVDQGPEYPDSQEQEQAVPRLEPLPGDLDSGEVSSSLFKIPELIRLDGIDKRELREYLL